MNKKHLAIFMLFVLYGTASLILLANINSSTSNQTPGVVYLQDYDCSMKYAHAKEQLRAYANLLHRIWVDNPSYVEDVLTETDEFCILEPLISQTDILESWSEDEIFFEPDTIPSQAPQDKLN